MIEGGRPLSLHPGHSVRQKVAPSTSTVRTSKPGPARPQLSHRKPSGQRSVFFGSLIPAPSPLDGGTSRPLSRSFAGLADARVRENGLDRYRKVSFDPNRAKKVLPGTIGT